jgi:hypothetical protein
MQNAAELAGRTATLSGARKQSAEALAAQQNDGIFHAETGPAELPVGGFSHKIAELPVGTD